MHKELNGPISTVKPRFRDFDIQGILNSSAFLEIISEVRLEQMETYYKLPMSEYLSQGQTWIISHYEITFKRPIKYPLSFRVQTQVEEIIDATAKVRFRFLAEKSNDEYTVGSLIYNLFDMNNKKTISISQKHADIFLNNKSKD